MPCEYTRYLRSDRSQQESYHEMELNAVLSSEQLDVLCAKEKFRDALGLWLAEGAVTWNPWQAGLAAIRERYFVSDPEASPPEGVAYSTWSQKLWSDLSEEVLGPEWRKMLKQGRATPRVPRVARLVRTRALSVLVWPRRGCCRRRRRPEGPRCRRAHGEADYGGC